MAGADKLFISLFQLMKSSRQIIYIFISIDEKLWEKFKEYLLQYDGFGIYSFYDDMKLLELDSTLNHVQSLESHTYC